MAAASATQIGSLIVKDARPIAVLTTYGARVFTSVAKLKQMIARGEVRYAFLNSYCSKHASTVNAACSAPARWIRAHGTDVSREAGLDHGGVLWLLPGAKPVSVEDADRPWRRLPSAPARPAGSRSTPSSWARAATGRCSA